MMSVIDSRRYGRPNMTNLTREEFEQIKNTPPSDLTELHRESARVLERVLKAREQENAGSSE